MQIQVIVGRKPPMVRMKASALANDRRQRHVLDEDITLYPPILRLQQRFGTEIREVRRSAAFKRWVYFRIFCVANQK